MKFDVTQIDKAKFEFVAQKGMLWNLRIHPITYKDKRNPRLPRKSSKQTNLQQDTNFFFTHAFGKVVGTVDSTRRFKVEIRVFRANDGLGGGDLDNYCKAILDGITATNKIWKDDRQVDELAIKRVHYSELEYSYIDLTIKAL